MAKVYRVEIRKTKSGEFSVVPTDANGRITLGELGSYASKWSAKRGARRAYGAKVKVVDATT
jgi:uncharacterized protein YegP (UPF0339 family)